MACRYNSHFVQKATEDLDGIIFYLTYQLGSPQAARTFLNSLDHTIQEACTFPESGSPLDPSKMRYFATPPATPAGGAPYFLDSSNLSGPSYTSSWVTPLSER